MDLGIDKDIGNEMVCLRKTNCTNECTVYIIYLSQILE